MTTNLVLNSGKVVSIQIPHFQKKRLSQTCFRPTSEPLAGNLLRWNSYEEFISDQEVQRKLSIELSRLERCEQRPPFRVEISLETDVGWDSVLEASQVSNDELKESYIKPLNARSCARFLKKDKVAAPLTNIVTLVLSRKRNSNLYLVQTVYPGPDAGELKGDLTENHGFIFLSWDNRGEIC